MTKQKMITIDDILKQKKLLEEDTNIYHSKLYDKDIEVVDADKQEIVDIVTDKNESEYRRYQKLIYLCCPICKNEEIRKAFEDRIKEPYDIIDIIFNNNISEVIELGNFLLKRYGFLDNETYDKLKK